MSSGSLFRRQKGGPVTVFPNSVAHAGWVYKQSKHLKFWRKRYLVLLKNGTALTFEKEQSLPPGEGSRELAPVGLGVPTEQFNVCALGASSALGRNTGTGYAIEDCIQLYVDYPSTRNRLWRKLPGQANAEGAAYTRRRFVNVDADMIEKLRWKAALREVLRRLPHMSAEDVREHQLEANAMEDESGTQAENNDPKRLSRSASEGDLEDLKGWAADLYQRR